MFDLAGQIWSTTAEMAPYLLFGFLVAGILSELLPSSFVEKHLGRGRLGPVLKASLLGVPLPLCSCGVIPVATGLRRHGASKAATTAFLISTPQTGIDSILVTYSLLGPVFAIFRPLAALLSGFFGGSLVLMADKTSEAPTTPAKENTQTTKEALFSRLAKSLRYGFVTLPGDIGSSLFIGLILSGLIAALVPDNFFSVFLGSRLLTMTAMLVVGIPLYVCATASVPVAAAFMAKGVSPGAALVFLMTGPATNAAAISTIWKIMGKRTAVLFLLAVAISSMASGLCLDLIVDNLETKPAPPSHSMLPESVGSGSAILLTALLLNAVLQKNKHGEASDCHCESKDEETIVLSVSGMSCSHCEAQVIESLEGVTGVRKATASAAEGKATVYGNAMDRKALEEALEATGHKA